MIFICLMNVLLPDSPVPVREHRKKKGKQLDSMEQAHPGKKFVQNPRFQVNTNRSESRYSYYSKLPSSILFPLLNPNRTQEKKGKTTWNFKNSSLEFIAGIDPYSFLALFLWKPENSWNVMILALFESESIRELACNQHRPFKIPKWIPKPEKLTGPESYS